MSHPRPFRALPRRLALLGAMVVSITAHADLLAQSGATAVSPEARRAAARYLASSGAEQYGKAFFAVSRRAVAERIRKHTPGLANRPDSIEALIAAGLPWQRVHDAAVDVLARRYGERDLARGVQLDETAAGRRVSDIWLTSVLSAWADFERRFPGISGGRVDAAKGTVDFDVDKPAVPLPNNPAPFFPSALRQANIAGSVQAEFVVTTAGRVDTTTFKPLRSTHELFTAAVRTMLPAWSFTPAELLGHRVNQRVVQQFDFALTPAVRKDTTPR